MEEEAERQEMPDEIGAGLVGEVTSMRAVGTLQGRVPRWRTTDAAVGEQRLEHEVAVHLLAGIADHAGVYGLEAVPVDVP